MITGMIAAKKVPDSFILFNVNSLTKRFSVSLRFISFNMYSTGFSLLSCRNACEIEEVISYCSQTAIEIIFEVILAVLLIWSFRFLLRYLSYEFNALFRHVIFSDSF
jgi:hypothetical protein